MKEARAGRKKAIVILNGISLRKKVLYHNYLPAMSSVFDVEVHETVSKNDAKNLAFKFAEKSADVIIAAGGDGTLHQVINGVLKSRVRTTNPPVIGIIPIGTGNDFFRSAGVNAEVDNTLARFTEFKPLQVDVGVVEYSSYPEKGAQRLTSWFVNIADIGMGPEVVAKVLNSGRPFGSEIAYYKSILSTFLSYRPVTGKAVTPEWSWEGKVRTLAVANGRYFGHGLCIAPDAVLNDGVFSVFICGNVSAFSFIKHAGSLKKGKKVEMKNVLYKQAATIELSSDAPCAIQADGEFLGWLPAKIHMAEKQLNLLV